MIAREEFIPQLQSFGLSISVHLLVVLVVVLSTMSWKPFRQSQPVGLTIEAVIVDTSAIRERREEAERAVAEAEQRKQAQEQRAKELEQQKQREKVAEQEKIRREAELEVQRKKQAQDKLAALRIERERQQEAERLKQQRELEQVRQQAEAAEKQRQQEAERLKQLEARKQVDAAEQRKQAELAAQQKRAEDEAAAKVAQQGRAASLQDKYEAEIQAIVTQNWLRPPTAQIGLRCKLSIMQIPGGEVISVAISSPCNGDDVTRRSIVAAVERVGMLPYRGYEQVFKREIDFIFIYDGD